MKIFDLFLKIKSKINTPVVNLKNNKRFKIGAVILLVLLIISSGIYIFTTGRQIIKCIGECPQDIQEMSFTCDPLTIVSLKNFAENSNDVKPSFGEKCQFKEGFLIKLIYKDDKETLKAKLGLESATDGDKKQIDGFSWVVKDKNSSLFLAQGNRLGILVLPGKTSKSKVKSYLGLGSKILQQEKIALSESLNNCEKISFKEGWEEYTLSIRGAQCDNFTDEANESNFKFKCQDPNASWRLYLVKEQGMKEFKNLTIKAKLGLIDHAKFFEESGGIGVKYDNYVELLVSKEDVRSSLRDGCNKFAVGDEWSKLCVVSEISPSIIGRCGVPKFTQSQECSIPIKVEGFDKIYLIFNVADAWLADVEGEISNLEICYE